MLLLLILLSIAFVISLGLLKGSIIEFAHFLRNRKPDQEILRVAAKGVYGKKQMFEISYRNRKDRVEFLRSGTDRYQKLMAYVRK